MDHNSVGYISNGETDTQPALKRSYQVVVAATSDLGIGKDGKLPWKLPGDLKFFKEVTTTASDPKNKNAVIMGRKTWESIPPQFQPLPGRLNVVLTRSENYDVGTAENLISCGSVSLALKLLSEPPYSGSIEKVFLIGGGEIFRETLNAPECDAIHITEIKTPIECDTFLPPIDMSIYQPWYSSSPIEENGIQYCFTTYVRLKTTDGHDNNSGDASSISQSKKFRLLDFTFLPKFIFDRHEEFLYLNLVQDIISNGNKKGDRTGTGTISKFGCQMRFNLRKSFPLLTTKRVFWRGVVEELLWFISGSTNAKILQDKGIHIWDGNASREYLDSIGLTDREEGDLGPVYGFQWRHFGAKYTNMHADYTGQGFDQLLDVIDKIKNKPDDRRIILSAWNPSDLYLMALPPCHMFAQFYVANGELSCQMYQRSADMGLGVPFNIASYSLLTCMIAHVCDLLPGDFIHVIGDTHVYKTHIIPLQEQLKKLPRPFPIARRRAAHMLKYPDAKVIPLGIEDTTQPIPQVIMSAMSKRSDGLSTVNGYSGYGAEQGEKQLRAAFAATYYADLGIQEDDIFVSNGAKSVISRLQVLFGSNRGEGPTHDELVKQLFLPYRSLCARKGVSKFGSVKVEKHMTVERYSHVMHISSTVTGELLNHLTGWDAVRATLLFWNK